MKPHNGQKSESNLMFQQSNKPTTRVMSRLFWSHQPLHMFSWYALMLSHGSIRNAHIYLIFFNLGKLLFFYHFLLLFEYSCLYFPTTISPAPPTPTSHPQSYHPLALSVGPLYMFLDDPFPSFPCYLPPPSPLVTVSLFFISVSLVIFCLLVCFVG